MGHLTPQRERLKLTRLRAQWTTPVEAGSPDSPSTEDLKLLADFTAEIRKRLVSSSENFDKAVLTLSSGGLAVSLGFLKDFVPVERSIWPWVLYTSWIALTGATVITMLSFLASARAQDYQQAVAEAYYLRREGPSLKSNPWDRLVIWMNRVSGLCFILGVTLTTLFVAINLQRAQEMKKVQSGFTQDGLTSPIIQRIASATDQQRGLTSPGIVPSAPTRPTSAPAPAPSTQSTPAKK